MAEGKRFKHGDVVMLRSGGPSMTVSPRNADELGTVTVLWFTSAPEAEERRSRFYEFELRRVRWWNV